MSISEDELRLREMTYRDGELRAEVEGGPAEALAGAFCEMLEKHNAENYIEVRFGSKFGPLMVTVQKLNGKTPHQLRAEAEARLSKAIELLEQAQEWVQSDSNLGDDIDAFLNEAGHE